jgi:mycothiol synthase
MTTRPETPVTAQVDRLTGALPTGAAQEVRDLAAAAERADGVAPLSEQPLLRLAGVHDDVVHLLAREPRDRALIGYAQVDLTGGSAELVVAPTARRRGVGTSLLVAARREVHAHDLADGPGAVRPQDLQVWAHGDLPAARGFAAAARMSVVRELWQLRLDLAQPLGTPDMTQPLGTGTADTAPRPESRQPPLPAGVSVRAFVPGQDEEAWRRVNARAFAAHPEQGRITRADLEAREREPWFDPAGFLLAERDGVLLASIWTKVHPAGAHGDEPVGEIYVLGVDPDAQGLGLGAALTALGLQHLRGLGLRSVILYTEAENSVALRTYVTAGFVRSAADVVFGSGTPGEPSGDTMVR